MIDVIKLVNSDDFEKLTVQELRDICEECCIVKDESNFGLYWNKFDLKETVKNHANTIHTIGDYINNKFPWTDFSWTNCGFNFTTDSNKKCNVSPDMNYDDGFIWLSDGELSHIIAKDKYHGMGGSYAEYDIDFEEIDEILKD